MNIFFLAKNATTAAQMHCDKHVVKMLIEYAQLLSTAHRIIDGDKYYGKQSNGHKIARWSHPNPAMDTTLYKATHVNHPSAVWTRESAANYMWVYNMWKALNDEFMYRYNKTEPHASYAKLAHVLSKAPASITKGSFTQPPQAMPDDCKGSCAVVAYRNYYINHKQHFATWKQRIAPSWFNILELV